MKSRTGIAAGIAVALSLMVAVLRFALDRGSSSYTPVPIDLEALPALPPRLPDATIELELVVGGSVVEVTPDPSLRLPDAPGMPPATLASSLSRQFASGGPPLSIRHRIGDRDVTGEQFVVRLGGESLYNDLYAFEPRPGLTLVVMAQYPSTEQVPARAAFDRIATSLTVSR